MMNFLTILDGYHHGYESYLTYIHAMFLLPETLKVCLVTVNVQFMRMTLSSESRRNYFKDLKFQKLKM